MRKESIVFAALVLAAQDSPRAPRRHAGPACAFRGPWRPANTRARRITGPSSTSAGRRSRECSCAACRMAQERKPRARPKANTRSTPEPTSLTSPLNGYVIELSNALSLARSRPSAPCVARPMGRPRQVIQPNVDFFRHELGPTMTAPTVRSPRQSICQLTRGAGVSVPAVSLESAPAENGPARPGPAQPANGDPHLFDRAVTLQVRWAASRYSRSSSAVWSTVTPIPVSRRRPAC
jgi:hypothetical protein